MQEEQERKRRDVEINQTQRQVQWTDTEPLFKLHLPATFEVQNRWGCINIWVFLTMPVYVWLFACVCIALTFCLPTMLWKGSSGLHVPSVKEVLEVLWSDWLVESLMMSSGSVSKLSSGCLIKKVSMLCLRRKSLRSLPWPSSTS